MVFLFTGLQTDHPRLSFPAFPCSNSWAEAEVSREKHRPGTDLLLLLRAWGGASKEVEFLEAELQGGHCGQALKWPFFPELSPGIFYFPG